MPLKNKTHQFDAMAARNLLVGLVVVAVLVNQSLSLERLGERDIHRLFKVDNNNKAPEYEVVYPQVVTEGGAFAVTGDALSSYTLRLVFHAFGEDFDLSLQRNDFGIAPDFQMKLISKEGTSTLPIRTDCMYLGTVNSDPASVATAETSDGLHVMIHRAGGPVYITPLKDHQASKRGRGLAHVAYKGRKEFHCGTENRMVPARFTGKTSAPKSAHTSSEVVLELAMYGDYELYTEHGDNTGMKLLILYGRVATLLEKPTLSSGNLMVKLTSGGVIKDASELTTSSNADESLSNCAAHAAANNKPRGQQLHFDNAAYITGFDLTGMEGLAYYMACGDDYAVSITEFLGSDGDEIPVAHEIAHNMGVGHDGAGNSCGYDFIMAPQIDPDASDWSTCSKTAFSDFVGSQWAVDDNGDPCYDDGGW